MDAKTFGMFIAELRKGKGLTQAQLAGQLHVTDKAVSRWERGVGLPDLANLEALAQALDVTVSELIQCKRQPEPDVDPKIMVQILSATRDIVKYQKRLMTEKIIFGLICLVAGAALLFAAVHGLTDPGIIIGGADGPTSIFIAGKVPAKITMMGVVLGAMGILGGLWLIVRASK